MKTKRKPTKAQLAKQELVHKIRYRLFGDEAIRKPSPKRTGFAKRLHYLSSVPPRSLISYVGWYKVPTIELQQLLMDCGKAKDNNCDWRVYHMAQMLKPVLEHFLNLRPDMRRAFKHENQAT